MNRRRFLQGAAAAIGGFTLDPELLLWRPGAKTFLDLHVPVVTALYDPTGRQLLTWVDATITKVVTDLERFRDYDGIAQLRFGDGARPWTVTPVGHDRRWTRYDPAPWNDPFNPNYRPNADRLYQDMRRA